MKKSTKLKIARGVRKHWKIPGYRDRISKALMGHIVSAETRKKISEATIKPKPEPSDCLCGCGNRASSGKQYIKGHYWRNKNHTKESKKKNAVAHIGKAHTKETKEMMSRSQKKRLAMPGVSERNSVIHSGINSASWKDGKFCWNSDGLHPYLKMFEYRGIRDMVKIRDGNKCILCSGTKRLDAHHVVPTKIGYRSHLCDHESNLVTLCRSCHVSTEVPVSEDRWKIFLPKAKIYLARFGYKKLLLSKHLSE